MALWLFSLLLLLGLAAPPQAGPVRGVAPPGSDLDRIALAVEGAESSFGADKAMWRPNPFGPQGPMQVSAAAAADVGSGDRFDPEDNRRLGRAYLTLLYRRYGNWPDAVVAYYWGPGNVDRWVASGHGPDALTGPLQAYLDRVMRGFLEAPADVPTPALAPPPGRAIAPLAPAEPPAAEIISPALREKYLADRAAIAQLRDYLEATQTASTGADADEIMGLIRRIAARPGYQQFASPRSARIATAPGRAALRQIASVMLDKLRSECAAMLLVDQRGAGHRL
jgi:hypothetical protein